MFIVADLVSLKIKNHMVNLPFSITRFTLDSNSVCNNNIPTAKRNTIIIFLRLICNAIRKARQLTDFEVFSCEKKCTYETLLGKLVRWLIV